MAEIILENIRTLANEKNISISRLETLCNLGNGTIQKLKNPRIETLNSIANALDCSVNDLISED